MEADPRISLTFAIPDHPWVDATDGAAVRIAMTVARRNERPGMLLKTIKERNTDGDSLHVDFTERIGFIHADLTIGAAVSEANGLLSNQQISNRGVCLFGAGFIVNHDRAIELGLGKLKGLENHIRYYRNGRDLTAKPRDAMVIDLFGLTTQEVRLKYPEVYQWLTNHVKPERDHNRDAKIRDDWWIHGRPRPELRFALKGLGRFIATVETAKHRVFQFLDASILPDNMLVVVALHDSCHLGVLSSRVHVVWSLAAGGRLGVGNDPRYNKSRCFEPFPFPEMTNPISQRIRDLGEQLDAHRKWQQAAHPELTLTGMYNVLEKLRASEPLTAKEKVIHEQGLVSVLKQIHDDLDAAVFEAYGWPVTLTDEEILERLVALNAERAEEEKRGLIRWLRPEFQNPSGGQAIQPELELETEAEDDEEAAAATTKKGGKAKKGTGKAAPGSKTKAPAKQPWPAKLSEQVQALIQKLQTAGSPLTSQELAKAFTRANADTIDELLETLVAIGKARQVSDDKFTAV